jgi:TrmH family RNA methyltransferase
MLSKNKIKFYNSLKLRKYRKKHSLFLAEGEKIIADLIHSGNIPQTIIKTEGNDSIHSLSDEVEIINAKKSEISKISNLKTPSDILAVFKTFDHTYDTKELLNDLVIFCDNIRDPGNFGTIIRTADWFGVRNIVCSTGTADMYNPKVIQSSMGSIARVHVHYGDADEMLSDLKGHTTIYGAYMNGKNIYEETLSPNGVIVIGNEGTGITDVVGRYIDHALSIPAYGNTDQGPESLNASIAAALICAEFRRSHAYM